MNSERFRLESPDARPRSHPPDPTGREVARFERRGHAGAPDGLLRLAVDEYQGRPYLSLRLFEADRDGRGWWPTKKGCSIRLSEARALAMALMQAVDRLESHDDRRGLPAPDRAASRDDRRPWRQPEPRRELPAPYRPDFDEFAPAG